VRILDGNNDGQAVVDMGAYESAVPITNAPCIFISCPSDITLPTAQGTNFALVNYPAPVGSPNAVVECSPVSGSGFPLGVSAVYCVASNAAGIACCQFTVTVVDNQLPSIKCSGNIATNVGALATNAVVTFAAPVARDNCGVASVNCSPASGSTFPLGSNPVTCSAVDTSGNTNSCAFNVVVQQTPTETHDLALLSIKVPKTIGLSDKKPSQTKIVTIQIQNLSDHSETIQNLGTFTNLVTLTIQSLGTCPIPATRIEPPKKTFPIVLAPKKKLTLQYNVIFNCANDRFKGDGQADFSYTVHVDHTVLDGNADTNPSNDECPHAANSNDNGCVPVTTDVFLK
jgi:hypothetical protein